MPCGAAYSVDAWLRDKQLVRRGKEVIQNHMVPMVGYRLIQIQLMVMYLQSGVEKWGSSSWRRGSALYYSLSTDNYARSDVMLAPLLDGPIGYEILRFGTWVTLYWEMYFALLVLWRPTRYLALIVGVLMHLGVHITLMVAFFSFVSLWGYFAFLPHDWVERSVARWRRFRERQGA